MCTHEWGHLSVLGKVIKEGKKVIQRESRWKERIDCQLWGHWSRWMDGRRQHRTEQCNQNRVLDTKFKTNEGVPQEKDS